MNKKGVLQIIDSLDTGGAEVLSVNIANSLNQQKINSHLCVTRKEGKLKENLKDEVGYLFLGKKKTVDIKSILKLKSYILEHNIHIIHAHSTSYFIAFCIKVLNPRLHLIWHDHYGVQEDLKKRKLIPIKLISKYFDAIISVNNNLKEWSKTKLNCKKVFFLNNFAVFNNESKITVLKEKGSYKIVHLAAFREQKDHEILINAFHKFCVNNINWTLHLIGDAKNKRYSLKIIKLINNKKLNKKVFIYGACLDIKNILSQAHIGVLSSKSEGLPIALLEYGLAKLPVIVTDVGECNKVITNNISGFLVKPNNTEKFVSKLNILANSEALRNSFGTEHYNNVTHNYSKELFLNNLLDIYNATFD